MFTSSSECWQQWLLRPASSFSMRKQSRCAQVRKQSNNLTSILKSISKYNSKYNSIPVEEKRGHTGSYGKQILYKTLAQVFTSWFPYSNYSYFCDFGSVFVSCVSWKISKLQIWQTQQGNLLWDMSPGCAKCISQFKQVYQWVCESGNWLKSNKV